MLYNSKIKQTISLTTEQKITFVNRLLVLAKQEYFSKKESAEKEDEEAAILHKLDEL